MSVNPVAARGFESAAGAYVRGRPSYPPAAIEWLAGHCALGPGATVVDVAAGTGKLTELLVGQGGTVIAVEPVAGMRAALTEVLPGVTALSGTADALPLPPGSADTIAIGQAYHWFAGETALAEFARVLRSDGRLALLWNARDLAQPLWREVSRIIEPLRDGTPEHGNGRWRESLVATTHFRLLAETQLPYRHLVDRQGLLDRVGSISFIAALEPTRRAAVLDELATLVANEPEPLPMDYLTEVYVFERAVG
jgi:SAM-dependent methyltransferase